MSARIKRNHAVLHALARARPATRTALLKSIPKDSVDAICDCAFNALNGSIPLKHSQKRKLKRYKAQIVKLANKKLSTIKKKKILQQRGGFLPVLLGAALSAVPSLIKALNS